MISSLQPSRPQPLSTQPLNPLCQQQIRHSHHQQHIPKPANQLQAMPPHRAPLQSPMPSPLPLPVYNPATTHPVFFTPSFRRPPFPVPSSNGFNPVATGYVFGDGRLRSQSMTKL